MGIILNPLLPSGFDSTGSGSSIGIGTPIAGSSPHAILRVDGSSNLAQIGPLTNGQLIIGSTGNAAVAATLTGTVNQLSVTNNPGAIVLSLPQDIHTLATPTFSSLTLQGASNQLTMSSGVNALTINSGTSAAARTYLIPDVGASSNFLMTEGTQTVNGQKTFTTTQSFTAATGISVTTRANVANLILNSSSLDVTATVGTDILNIGALNADVINIGNPASVVNIQGTVNNVQTTNLNVTDSLITINDGGPASSGGGSGFEVEEAGVATGYVKVSSDRNKWSFKAPAKAGEIELDPPATGTLTINQALFDSKANVTLNNLTTTAINANLLPDSNLSRNIGSSLLNFNALFAQSLTASSGNLTLSAPGAASRIILSALGSIEASNLQIKLVANPTANQDAATKIYVDNAITGLNEFNDSLFRIRNTTDQTRRIAFSAANISTATTRTITMPNADVNLGALADANIAAAAAIARTKIANGSAHRIIVNNASGTLSEAAALTNGQLLVGSTGAAPVAATLTSGLGISVTNGAGTITIANTLANTGDIVPTTFSGVANANNATVTGFAFTAPRRAFTALVSVNVDATTQLNEQFTLQGIRKASSWEMSVDSVGDASLVTFSINASGQVLYSSGIYPGFNSINMIFRAITVGI